MVEAGVGTFLGSCSCGEEDLGERAGRGRKGQQWGEIGASSSTFTSQSSSPSEYLDMKKQRTLQI
jgi:hypothetical protein